jgi:hypothetical protein
MTKWAAALTALLATNSFAKPIEVDLSAERAEYEAKARPRNIALTLLGVSVASFGGGGISTWYAGSARTQLLLQQVPVDLSLRQELIASGTTTTVLAATMFGLGIALAALSVYFLVVSF